MKRMISRRKMLDTCLRAGLSILLPLAGVIRDSFAADDPRPEFSAAQIDQVLLFYFGTSDAADDASIEIEAPLNTTTGALVPFRVRAPGAERLVVLTDCNPQPLVLAMDRVSSGVALASGRARIGRSGKLYCFALKNGILSRTSRPISLGGHWQDDIK